MLVTGGTRCIEIGSNSNTSKGDVVPREVDKVQNRFSNFSGYCCRNIVHKVHRPIDEILSPEIYYPLHRIQSRAIVLLRFSFLKLLASGIFNFVDDVKISARPDIRCYFLSRM